LEVAGRVSMSEAVPAAGRITMAAHLRVFPESLDSTYDDELAPNVRVSLRDLLPLLAMAKRQKYLWLNDFLDDEVRITADLYEVIRAFSTCRRPSA
jgi:hypothetical protein